MYRKEEKQQNGGMKTEYVILVVMSPFLLLIAYHIIYLIYLMITGTSISWNIDIKREINKGRDSDSGIINFFLISYNILYNILIKPYIVY
tara:strand:+ start:1479 stop:1748 length:270 start_codon:yes stop_codon:yes gene_type:complete